MLVSSHKVNRTAYCLANETAERCGVSILDDLANHITFARDSADNADLARSDSARDVRLLIPMAVLVFCRR